MCCHYAYGAIRIDNGKVVGKASCLLDCELNQTDLDAVYGWSVINQLPLCQPKSQCLHIHENGCYTYKLGGTSILAIEECTNLSVIRTSEFSYTTHIRSVVKKASYLSGMLLGRFQVEMFHL